MFPPARRPCSIDRHKNMRRLLIPALLLTAAIGAHSQTADPGKPSTATTPASINNTFPERSAQVDVLMAPWSGGKTPGAAIAVIRKGEILLEKGYGLANLKSGTPIDPHTVFNIASVSKQFTAMAVMILADRGKLDYSDPISKYFPDFPAYGRQITIKQLLNHTSGLADYTIYWKEGPRVEHDGARHASEDVLKFLISQKAGDFLPGERWRYSNSGYVLLSLIVGKISGVPFSQFLKDNIFGPLVMKDSSACIGIPAQPNRAAGYIQNGSGFKEADKNPNNFICGDGEVNSSIADMYKWDQALNTEKLVKAATLNAAFTSGKLNDGTKFNYGFGWALGKFSGVDFVSHSGGIEGYVAHIVRFPDRAFTVILLSNFEQLPPSSYALANKITGIYLSGQIPAQTPATIDTKLLADLAGTYEFFNIGMKVTLEKDSLWLTSQRKKVKLVPVGADEFIADGNSDSAYRFMRNDKGQVTGLSLLHVNGLFLTKKL
jgi:CubicO group peptidase (beta-lactamase class C family)